MSLRKKVGQLLMIGFDGYEVDNETEALLRDCHIGGIILFARNVKSIGQVRRLTTKLRSIAKHQLLISADQEGGVVVRFKDATVFPGNMALGAISNEEIARKVGSATGKELQYLGIDLNLAPVLDVNNNPQNPGIGVRSFSDNPYVVKRLGRAFIEGHQKWCFATAKHFPGKGDITIDSHIDLPTVSHSRERLECVELVPFVEAIEASVGAIMTAHVTFPAYEPTEGLPATLSKAVLTGLLKEKLGFSGVVITDDLEMGAIDKHFGIGEAAVRAVEAGADIVLVCHTKKAQKEAYDALVNAFESGRIPLSRLEDALKRIEKLKVPKQAYADINWKEHYQLSQITALKAITVLLNNDLPLTVDQQKVGVFFPMISGLVQVEDVFYSETLGPFLRDYGIDCEETLYPLNPSRDEIETILEKAKDKNIILFASYNAHLNHEQTELGKALASLNKPFIVIALRNPYDYYVFREATSFICTYSYRNTSLRALSAVLTGRASADGALPLERKDSYV